MTTVTNDRIDTDASTAWTTARAYLRSDEFDGLTDDEAADRFAAEGANELPSTKPRSVMHIALGVLREPIFLLLVACGAIYLFLGDLQEAVMLLGFVLLIAVITLVQEHKTERTLEALRDLSSPRALVIRSRRHPEEFHKLFEFAMRASQRDPFDSMERAINNTGEGLLADTEHLLANIAPILTNRSWSRTALRMFASPNPALWWVTVGAVVLLATILTVPVIRDSFGFGSLTPYDFIWCLGAGMISVVWFEIWKYVRPAYVLGRAQA